MYLVSALESDDDPPETKMRLCAIANCALELRGCSFTFFKGKHRWGRLNGIERSLSKVL